MRILALFLDFLYLITQKSTALFKNISKKKIEFFFNNSNNSAIFGARDLKFLPKIIKKYFTNKFWRKINWKTKFDFFYFFLNFFFLKKKYFWKKISIFFFRFIKYTILGCYVLIFSALGSFYFFSNLAQFGVKTTV